MEDLLFSLVLLGRRIFFLTTNNPLGLRGRCQFNDIGNKQMARRKGEEDQAEDYILFSIVMALDANKNAVLERQFESNGRSWQRTFIKFSTIKRRFIATVDIRPWGTISRASRIPRTITMRLRNPRKLVVAFESRLRLECRRVE